MYCKKIYLTNSCKCTVGLENDIVAKEHPKERKTEFKHIEIEGSQTTES